MTDKKNYLSVSLFLFLTCSDFLIFSLSLTKQMPTKLDPMWSCLRKEGKKN